VLIVLLAGGDKSSEAADIATTKEIAEAWGSEHGRDLHPL
jgi:putative component of toxin-antitoxin plasmid stabilization module